MNALIKIDTRTFIKFWSVPVLFLLAAWIIYSARTAIVILLVAAFLAIALSPPVNRLAKILPSKSRVLSTAIAYVVVVLLLGAVVFLVIPPIADQTVKFVQSAPSLIDSATKQSQGLSKFINHYHLQPEADKVVVQIKDDAAQFAASLGSIVINGIGSLLSMTTAFILILVLAFLMLVEGPMWLDRIWGEYTSKTRMQHHKTLARNMYNTVTSYVTGQLTVSSIAGIVAGVAVFVLSLLFNIPVSLAIPSATLIFVASLIPLFGEVVGSFLVATILALNNITAAVIFLVFFIIYQQIEANYISPQIQSKRVALPALAILTSVTIGIYVFGIAGGIISIPIAGCIKVLITDYNSRRKEKHEVSHNNVTKVVISDV